MARSSHADFRLPPSALNRQFAKISAAVGLAILVSNVAVARGNLTVLLLTVLTVGAVLVGGYFMCRHHVWVTLSTDGISGRGYTGRVVHIRWDEDMAFTPSFYSGMKGAKVSTRQNAGPIKSRFLAVFVPDAILQSPSFHAAALRLAPQAHPFRELAQRSFVLP